MRSGTPYVVTITLVVEASCLASQRTPQRSDDQVLVLLAGERIAKREIEPDNVAGRHRALCRVVRGHRQTLRTLRIGENDDLIRLQLCCAGEGCPDRPMNISRYEIVAKCVEGFIE